MFPDGGALRRPSIGSAQLRARAATCDRLEQAVPVAKDDPESFGGEKIRVGQVGQDYGVDAVVAERRFILAKP